VRQNAITVCTGNSNSETVELNSGAIIKRYIFSLVYDITSDGKGKGHPITGHQGPREGIEV
jgi:hypothetical protein